VTLAVREVDLPTELPLLVDVFNRAFNLASPRSRFDWLYCRNPDGLSTAWFVVDDRSGEIAGCTAVFPRRIQVRGQKSAIVGWNCGDFCILPRYRAGGAAIKLRRAARDGVDAGVRPFLYAHPNDRMLQIHIRVGHQPLGRMVRLARPTRLADRGWVGRIGTLGLRAARVDRVGSRRDDYEIEFSSLPADLDVLFEQLRPTLGTALVRDVRYLTWRFLDCPLHEYRIVLARRGSRLSGYLAFCVTNDQLLVKDWLGLDSRAVRTLFSAAIDQACAVNAASASVTLLETHRDRSLIRSLGFATRPETSTSITYAPECLPWRADVISADAWYMTVGDRDV
jgi:hypothetical protein